MLKKNITFKGIYTLIFITMGVSQVSLTIQNVDAIAGTLDIYMTNVAGCGYCTDATYPEAIRISKLPRIDDISFLA